MTTRTHLLHCGDCTTLLPSVGTETVDLAILDPPYFRVLGEEWDRQWRTEVEYREWASTWIKEVCRATRLGGSIYLFGYVNTLLQLVPLFDGFDLRQQIVVTKGLRSISGRNTKPYKMFPVTTEQIAFLVKDSKPYIRKLLLKRQKALGLTSKQINERLGMKSNGGGVWSLYTGENILAQVPTRELWEKLSRVLNMNVPYEQVAMTFNLTKGLTDVWDDIDFYSETRIHRAQKPLKLIWRLIEASTDVSDTVLDPFLGSGSTCVVAEELGRRCIGIECDREMYVKLMARMDSKKALRCVPPAK
jgi:DNA modification methylase